MIKKLLTTLGLLMISLPSIADREHPIGISTTFSHTTRVNFSYDVLSSMITAKTANCKCGNTCKCNPCRCRKTKPTGFSTNLGLFVAQRETSNWDRLTIGPQFNIEYNRLFTSVNYDTNNKRTFFTIGGKF